MREAEEADLVSQERQEDSHVAVEAFVKSPWVVREMQSPSTLALAQAHLTDNMPPLVRSHHTVEELARSQAEVVVPLAQR